MKAEVFIGSNGEPIANSKQFDVHFPTAKKNFERKIDMSCRQGRALTLIICLLWGLVGEAQNSISAAEAKDHVAESATVCGEVVSTHYATRSRGNPTFINLDKPYPNQVFTLVIWGTDRPKFGNPEENYRSKYICVTGKVSAYRGVPEMVAHEPSQVRVQLP